MISTRAMVVGDRLGQPETARSTGARSSASVAPPKAADRKPDRVTPICTAERKRLGFSVEPGHRLAALAPVGQLADLALAQRDQRHLGSGEDAADDDEDTGSTRC